MLFSYVTPRILSPFFPQRYLPRKGAQTTLQVRSSKLTVSSSTRGSTVWASYISQSFPASIPVCGIPLVQYSAGLWCSPAVLCNFCTEISNYSSIGVTWKLLIFVRFLFEFTIKPNSAWCQFGDGRTPLGLHWGLAVGSVWFVAMS